MFYQWALRNTSRLSRQNKARLLSSSSSSKEPSLWTWRLPHRRSVAGCRGRAGLRVADSSASQLVPRALLMPWRINVMQLAHCQPNAWPLRCHQHVQSKFKGKCLHWGESLLLWWCDSSSAVHWLNDRDSTRAQSDQEDKLQASFSSFQRKMGWFQFQLTSWWLQIYEPESDFVSFEKSSLFGW